jgi:hypothetical protein
MHLPEFALIACAQRRCGGGFRLSMLLKRQIYEHVTNDSSLYECLPNLWRNVSGVPSAERAFEVGEFHERHLARPPNNSCEVGWYGSGGIVYANSRLRLSRWHKLTPDHKSRCDDNQNRDNDVCCGF